MKNKILILNAPPNAGKDVIASVISELTGASHQEFKDTLYRDTAEVFNVAVEWLKEVATDRDTKDIPNEFLSLGPDDQFRLSNVMGDSNVAIEAANYRYITPREALIFTSECVKKPMWGDTYFGIAAAGKVDFKNGTVFSDGGFDAEILPLVEKFGAENVFVAKFIREGVDSFDGDSRDWLNMPEGVSSFYFENNKSIYEAAELILLWLDNCDEADEIYKLTTTGEL